MFIPKDNFNILIDDYSQLENKGGVYRFYNSYDELIYIGISNDIQKRIHTHLFAPAPPQKTNTTWLVRHHFHSVKGFYEENEFKRDAYETHLINFLQPPCNRSKVETYKSKFNEYVHPVLKKQMDDEWVETQKRLNDNLQDFFL